MSNHSDPLRRVGRESFVEQLAVAILATLCCVFLAMSSGKEPYKSTSLDMFFRLDFWLDYLFDLVTRETHTAAKTRRLPRSSGNLCSFVQALDLQLIVALFGSTFSSDALRHHFSIR